MPFVRCPKGEHVYDDEQHSNCPYCRQIDMGLFTPPKRTSAAPNIGTPGPPPVKARAVAPTEAFPPPLQPGDPTVATPQPFDPPPTLQAFTPQQPPPTPTPSPQPQPQPARTMQGPRPGNPVGKTVALIDEANEGFDPVVGWLVVKDGPAKGRDFRVRNGWNAIGRDPSCWIYVDFDNTVSMNKHAYIVFDCEVNAFFIKHGEGANGTRLNGVMVGDLTPLQAFDVIKAGKTEMVFIPLCGEHFQWTGTTRS